jgi:heme exporter protein D
MNWNSWGEFLAMGGYAPYVWGALGVVFGSMGVEILLLSQRGRSVRTQLRAQSRAHLRAVSRRSRAGL